MAARKELNIYTHAFYSIVNNQKMEHKPEMESVYEKSLAPDPEEA